MRIMSMLVVAALLLGGMVAPVVAAPQVTVSIGVPDEVPPDSDFTANVAISEVTDFDACNYDVSFDASVLRLDNVTSGLIGSTTIPVDAYNEINPGTWRVVQNVPGLSGVHGSGYLAVLHLHVIGSQGDSSAISLSNGILSSNQAEEIMATWEGNSIGVVVAEPAAPEVSENTTPPAVTSSSPEATMPPTEESNIPGTDTVGETEPIPSKLVNWPVLWGIVGGVMILGLIIFLIVRRRAY